ncbi:MAG: hypothetical protein KZQ99_15340 [Candidatus Thiodiazotropha sp. (ex Dulcina madagascariensis)]|nr:hypothetical protein [Candidatus Thiodiazotropha sp. (ex Dulcina madagascariensis)]
MDVADYTDVFTRLLRQRPPEMQPVGNGDRLGVIYAEGRERVYVMAFEGRTYKVLHTYEPDKIAGLITKGRVNHEIEQNPMGPRFFCALSSPGLWWR